MPKYEVTFETKCYEKDWEKLLKTNRIEQMIRRNQYPFKEKVLFVNNVRDVKRVKYYADKLVDSGILTSYVVVEDYADEALKFFDLKKESFKGGYYYSIAELVGIYLCKTEYLLHFSSDSILERPFNWIGKSIQVMKRDPRVKVANPVWNRNTTEAINESIRSSSSFLIGQGFSDQCYLIKVKDFRGQIYKEKNLVSSRFPKYGGELFEKRVDSWMRNYGFHRITYKHGSYIHKNF